MRAAILLSSAAGLASAHFGLEYPAWRGDSLAENTTLNQWDYPCAGAPYGAGNKTEWPLEGGSVVLDLHHPWSYVYINLGLGQNSSNFNISLTPSLLNVTGKGTFCLPSLPIPTTISDGQEASIQIVTNGASGSALYNCADITFKASAKPLDGGICSNSTGVTATVVGETVTDTGSSESPKPSSAAVRNFGDHRQGVLGMVVALALVMTML
ncbi:hypothetical protein F5Y17DRAFT_471297 [Xylariaceae sp. FL0594]|nr:hypothetical protein F5Y17DRAFT_471297 [Xylariaceae sp. FL0594]